MIVDGKVARLDVRKLIYKNEINVIRTQSIDILNASYEALVYAKLKGDYIANSEEVLDLANAIWYSTREINIIIGKSVFYEHIKPYILDVVNDDISQDKLKYNNNYLKNRYFFIADSLHLMKHSNWFHGFCGGHKFIDDILRQLEIMNYYLPIGGKYMINKTEEEYFEQANSLYYLV